MISLIHARRGEIESRIVKAENWLGSPESFAEPTSDPRYHSGFTQSADSSTAGYSVVLPDLSRYVARTTYWYTVFGVSSGGMIEPGKRY